MQQRPPHGSSASHTNQTPHAYIHIHIHTPLYQESQIHLPRRHSPAGVYEHLSLPEGPNTGRIPLLELSDEPFHDNGQDGQHQYPAVIHLVVAHGDGLQQTGIHLSRRDVQREGGR